MVLLLLFSFLLCAFSLHAQMSGGSVRPILRSYNIPGMQVAHVKPGETHLYALGVKRQGEDSVVTDETVFQAASLTKVVAAYAFFKLVDQGLMHPDTPLYKYHTYSRIQNNPEAQKITARMVLTHRSGLLNWEGAVSTQAWKNSALHLQFAPGSAYMYSGEGFYFLQLAMESASGKTFQSIIEEEVLRPLGMVHSQIVWKDTLRKQIAIGHLDSMRPRSIGMYRSVNAAYTLYTTAYDYTLFIQKALHQGVGLSASAHRLMTTEAGQVQKGPAPSPEDAHVPVAMGLRLQKNETGTWLWHTGSNPGFRCFFISNPGTGESLAVFMNAETGFDAMHSLMKMFLGSHQTWWAYLWRQGELD